MHGAEAVGLFRGPLFWGPLSTSMCCHWLIHLYLCHFISFVDVSHASASMCDRSHPHFAHPTFTGFQTASRRCQDKRCLSTFTGFQTVSGQTGFSQKGHISLHFAICCFMCARVATFAIFCNMLTYVVNFCHILPTFLGESSLGGIVALLRRPRLS